MTEALRKRHPLHLLDEVEREEEIWFIAGHFLLKRSVLLGRCLARGDDAAIGDQACHQKGLPPGFGQKWAPWVDDREA